MNKTSPHAEPNPRVRTARNATVLIAVVVAGAAFYWLAAILTPLALALFLLVMIDSFARVLVRRAPRIPHGVAQVAAIVLSIAIVGLAVMVVVDNAAGFVGQLNAYGPRLNALIARTSAAMGMANHPTVEQLISQFNPSAYVGVAADRLKNFAGTAVLVLVYLGFLMASRQTFPRKATKLFASYEARQEAVEIFQRIRDGVERYLWIQVVCGLMMAIPAWGLMALVGLDNAVFWAFLIFVVGFIPIIGGAMGVAAPPLFALVQFESPWPALILFVLLNVLGVLIGNIIYPRMQGKSLNLDPIAVLLSLAFWGAIWGLPGMVLSTPLTVATMIILAQFDGARWIAVLLSSDGDPLGAEASMIRAADAGPAAAPRLTGPPLTQP
ncbi:MAG: AI-2E family transporter [Caulobacteraceae bacterium]|nr:AI-2E family transporter [Caulobacteraceae bacterium]